MGKTIIWGLRPGSAGPDIDVTDYAAFPPQHGSTPEGTVAVSDDDIDRIVLAQLLGLPEAPVASADLPLEIALTVEERPAIDGSSLPILAQIPAVGHYNGRGGQPVEFTYTKVLTIVEGRYAFLARDNPERDPQSAGLLELIAAEEAGKHTPVLSNRLVRKDGKLFHPVREKVVTLKNGEMIVLKGMEGGYGILKFAYDTTRDEIIVLKSARKTGNKHVDRKLEECLRTEAWMQATVFETDPEIMESYGLEEIDGVQCHVMPYAEMKTSHLFAAAKQRYDEGDHMTLTDTFYDVARQLRNAIRKLHDKDVIYLDLKADNVLWKLDDHGRPQIRLIDFGTAITNAQARIGQDIQFTVDTVEPQLLVPFLATEIFGRDVAPPLQQGSDASTRVTASRLDYEKQADVYSLAATLEEMIADVLEVTLDTDYVSHIWEYAKGRQIHPAFAFAKTTADRKNLAALREANQRRGGMFADDVFDFIGRLKSPRIDRPDIDEIVEVEVSGRGCLLDILRPVRQTTVDAVPYSFQLSDAKESANHMIASAIADAAAFIAINEKNGWIYGRVEYKRQLNGKPVIEISDRMSVGQAKRFTDFTYLNPSFAEPEQYLTYELPALAPQDVREYWKREQRIDIEAEAKIYEVGMAVLRYMADVLDVSSKLHTFERHEAKVLLDSRLERLQEMGMDDVVRRVHPDFETYTPIRGIVGYLASQHAADYHTIKAANDEQQVFDPALFDLLCDMLQHRTERMKRVPFDKLRERTNALAMKYRDVPDAQA